MPLGRGIIAAGVEPGVERLKQQTFYRQLKAFAGSGSFLRP